MRIALILALALGAALATGARAAASDEGVEITKPVNLWPLLYEERGPEHVDIEALFSLIYYQRDRRKLSLGFRPFYSQLNDPELKQKQWNVLWQFAVYDREGATSKLRVLPLYWQKLSPPSSYTIFFPFFNFKRDEKEREIGVLGYAPFSLFDFRKEYETGTVRDRFLIVMYQREAGSSSFSVAPLYTQTESSQKGEEQLFPIFHHAWDKPEGYSQFSMLGFPETWNLFETMTDEKREASEWHALLAYSKTDDNNRIRVFAPFYFDIHTQGQDTFHLWPFYGISEKDSETTRSTFWPFFRWSRDPVADDSQTDLFWPLFQYHRSPELNHDRLLPLYAWTRQTESKEPTKLLPWGLYLPLPLFYRQTGVEYSFNRFFYLAWLTRKGDARHDFVLNYYNVEPDSTTRHVGLFPLWHRSRWPGGKLDLAPLYVSYERPDLSFRTAFPLYWQYGSPTASFKAAVPLYYEYSSSSSTFKTVFPFYFHSTDAALDSELTYYFPFYGTYRRGPRLRRQLFLFPLWSRVKDEQAGLEEWDALWPFFHYDRSPERSSVRLLPLFWSRRAPDGDFAIGFPFYWHLRSSVSTQTHLIPLFGEYEKPGFSLRYVLGPLYIDMEGPGYRRIDLLGSLYSYRKSGEDQRSHFFPLYWSWSSPGYGQKLLFPFVGVETASPTYRSLYFLGFQPTASLAEFTRDPANDYALTRFLNVYFRRDRGTSFGTVFPLYWQWSDLSSKGSLLFPLFAASSDSADGSFDYALLGLTGGLSLFESSREAASDEEAQRALLYYHRRNGDRHMRVVAPLFWQWSEPAESKTFLFPLFTAHRDSDGRSWGLLGFTPAVSLFSVDRGEEGGSSRLFPLYGWRRSGETRELSLLGVWHGVSLFYAETSTDSVRNRFVPLYAYDRSSDKKHFGILWRVVYYEREGPETDLRILFRLVRVHRSPEESNTEVNPFYFKITRKDSSYWAILGGLFGVETRPDGTKKYQYLWVL